MEVIRYLVLLAILGIIVFFRQKKLKSQGLIIDRGKDQELRRYFYTLRPISLADVFKKLSEIDFAGIKLANLYCEFDHAQNRIVVGENTKLAKWSGCLSLVCINETWCQYAFNFSEFPQSVPQGMLIFQTALEKMFLEYDWETTVESIRLKTRTKTGITQGRVEVIE